MKHTDFYQTPTRLETQLNELGLVREGVDFVFQSRNLNNNNNFLGPNFVWHPEFFNPNTSGSKTFLDPTFFEAQNILRSQIF